MSASPRSKSARRLPADGTMRQITRRTFGSGPPFQLSLRSRMTSLPAFQVVDLVGAAAGGVELGVLEPPRVLFGRLALHQFGIDHARHDHGEIGDSEPVLAQEIDADGVVVDHHELLRLGERAGAHLEGREAADRDGAVERPFDVLGGDRLAVLEGRVLLELEGDRHVADVHVVGELELELVAVVILRAVRQRLHLVADESVVAVPRHFVAGHVGADAVDVEIVWPAFGDDQQRLLPPLRAGGREDRRRRHRAGGKRSHGFEEIATFHAKSPFGFDWSFCRGLRKAHANRAKRQGLENAAGF